MGDVPSFGGAQPIWPGQDGGLQRYGKLLRSHGREDRRRGRHLRSDLGQPTTQNPGTRRQTPLGDHLGEARVARSDGSRTRSGLELQPRAVGAGAEDRPVDRRFERVFQRARSRHAVGRPSRRKERSRQPVHEVQALVVGVIETNLSPVAGSEVRQAGQDRRAAADAPHTQDGDRRPMVHDSIVRPEPPGRRQPANRRQR